MSATILQPSAECPSEWRKIEFDSFTTLKRGKDLTRSEFRIGTVPVAGSNGVIGFHDTANVKGPGVTVGRSGSVGRVTYYEEDFWAHNTALFVTNYHGNDPRFAAYFLDYLRLGRFGSGVSVPTLDRNSFRNLPVTVPPLPEQRKIAAVLGTVQKAIEQQERSIQTTTELKKTLMKKLFTEGLRGEPQKKTEIGLVPESWEVVRLEKVCTFKSGGTPSKQNPEYWQGSIPWVSPKDMKKPRLSDVIDHISDSALEDGSSLAPAGSVFVVVRGMILAKDVPVALAEVPLAFNQDMKAIIPGPSIVPSFLLYALCAFKGNLAQKIGRSAHGTMTLMSSELEQFSIPLPDLQTQEEIAAAIKHSEQTYEQHCRKRSALSDLFRTLLHQLMTAQARVNLGSELLPKAGS
jgi:type I restriction enzyme S subunit